MLPFCQIQSGYCCAMSLLQWGPPMIAARRATGVPGRGTPVRSIAVAQPQATGLTRDAEACFARVPATVVAGGVQHQHVAGQRGWRWRSGARIIAAGRRRSRLVVLAGYVDI